VKWPHIALGELCSLVNGRAFKEEDWSKNGLPIIRIQNLNGDGASFNHWDGPLDKQVIVHTNDLLLAWSGTPGTSFGAHIWHGSEGVLNQHIFRVDLDSPRIDRKWAVRAINDQLNHLITLAHGGVGLKHVTREVVQQLRILLPPLEEQRRIAAILDKADALRQKRRLGLRMFDSLTQSIFLDMFGDPVLNPFKWHRAPLSEVLARIDSGTSPVCLDRPALQEEWGVLKLGAVTRCEFDGSQQKALPMNYSADPELEVKPEDLLFTRKNTRELVAACALVHSTRPRLLLPDLIFRLVLRPGAPVTKDYLHRLLIYPSKRKEMQMLAGGSAGSMPNISKGKLLDVLIEVPPAKLQLEFSRKVHQVRSLKETYRKAIEDQSAAFDSLQSRAFRGEL